MSKRLIAGLAIVLILGAWVLLRGKPGPSSLLNEASNSESTKVAESNSLDKVAQPSGDTKTTGVPTSSLSSPDQHKLQVLREILQTKNDNDPRMDKELMVLSPELKRAMMKEYESIAGEKRNDRGTIVFLVGRNVKDQADVDFLKSVLMEKPCLGLSDCGKAPPPPAGEEEHLESVNETTLNYPQLNSLRAMIDSYTELSKDPNGDRALQASVLKAIEDSTRSPNPKVAHLAEQAVKLLRE